MHRFSPISSCISVSVLNRTNSPTAPTDSFARVAKRLKCEAEIQQGKRSGRGRADRDTWPTPSNRHDVPPLSCCCCCIWVCIGSSRSVSVLNFAALSCDFENWSDEACCPHHNFFKNSFLINFDEDGSWADSVASLSPRETDSFTSESNVGEETKTKTKSQHSSARP